MRDNAIFASQIIRRAGAWPLGAAGDLKSALRWSMIDAGISAGGCNGEPGHVMRPAPVVACALRLVGKAAMGHAQQRAAVALDQIDLDQARSRRHLLATLPTEGVDETVDRHDLSKRAARNPGVVAAEA